MLRVLGIDPGMTRLGWGSVILDGDELSLGLSGLIAHPREDESLFNEYLNDGIAQLAEQFPVLLSVVLPDFIAAEVVPVGRLGSRSELNVAAITVCKTIAFQWGIPWYDIGANTIKKIVAESGTATKAQVRNAVLDAFPALADKHKTAKASQKELGEKIVGIPQDVFDGIATAIAGLKQHGEDYGNITEGTTQGTERNLSTLP